MPKKFLTRKKGSRRLGNRDPRVGKPFPVVTKRTPPKIKYPRIPGRKTALYSRVHDIARDAIASEFDELSADPEEYIEGIGWNPAHYTEYSIETAGKDAEFSSQDVDNLTNAILEDIRLGDIATVGKYESPVDYKGGVSTKGEINILESDTVADFRVNLVAEELKRLLVRRKARRR